ncbi:tail fiber domain-containing protein [Pragia fontium]|uniref:tail fiber domain-containing protein n=1 Tax=Pragia fontium TaxID=82985 RepID=UPI00064B4975|nr:tail fiber domain-containing protein [Pragia fontium]AKJ41486.1 hypothetical protein QQ39_04810 [Pragia fontium]
MWYRTGKISGSCKKIIGTNTKWKDDKMGIGGGQMLLTPASDSIRIYEIKRVVSNTEIELVDSLTEELSDAQYAIASFYTDSVPSFARQLSSQLKYYQSQLDGWQNILTGKGHVEFEAPDGSVVKLSSMSELQAWSADARIWFDEHRDDIANAAEHAIVATDAAKLAEKITIDIKLAENNAKQSEVGAKISESNVEQSVLKVDKSLDTIISCVAEAQTAANSVKMLKAAAETLSEEKPAFAKWESDTNTLNIGVPKGLKGDKGDQGEPGPAFEFLPLLNSFADLTTESDQLIYSNGINTVTTTPFSTFSRELLTQATKEDMLDAIGLGGMDEVAKQIEVKHLANGKNEKLVKIGNFLESARFQTPINEMKGTSRKGESVTTPVYPTANGSFDIWSFVDFDESKVRNHYHRISAIEADKWIDGEFYGNNIAQAFYGKTYFNDEMRITPQYRVAGHAYPFKQGALNLTAANGGMWASQMEWGAPIVIDNGAQAQGYTPFIKGYSVADGDGWATAISFGSVGMGSGSFQKAAIQVMSDNMPVHGHGVLTLDYTGRMELGNVSQWCSHYPDGNITGTVWSGYNLRGELNAHGVSDRNHKVFIQPTKVNPMDYIQQMEFVEFGWKYEMFPYKDTENVSLGVIAQDLQKIDPALVVTRPDGTLAVDTLQAVSVALAAVKQLNERVSELESQLSVIK